MKKLIAIILSCIIIIQMFAFSSFAFEAEPTVNEIVEAVVSDYTSTASASQKKVLNKVRANSVKSNDTGNTENPKKESGFVQFFKRVGEIFKSLFAKIRNLFKKPEKPTPEPTPTPIKYYEPYADPDPEGEHIRENYYLANEPFVNTNKKTYGDDDTLLPNMCKIASWVEPEYLNAYPKVTYGNKTIHIGSTEDYMLYTFGRPTETITFNLYGNKEYIERIHVYAEDINNVIIFFVTEFNVGNFNFSYIERNDDINYLYSIQSEKYKNNLPNCLKSESLNVARTLQTAIGGIYTNSDNIVFESPGIIRTDYTSVKTRATISSYSTTILAEPSSSSKTLKDYEARCKASGLSNKLNVNGNEASLSINNQELKKLHHLLSYNPDNNTYSVMPHTSGNEMIVEYYFSDGLDVPSGMNVSLIPGRRGIRLGVNGSISALSSCLSDDNTSEKTIKIKLFFYVINSINAKENKELKVYGLDEINAFLPTFRKQITL